MACLNFAYWHYKKGDLPAAQQRLHEAIQAALLLDKPQKANALYGAVMLLYSTRPADAAAWITLLEPLPETVDEYRRRLLELHPALETTLGAEGYLAACEHGKTLHVDQVLEELLRT